MRGEFMAVWAETWHEIWLPLVDEPIGATQEVVDGSVFCDLYRELSKALSVPPSVEDLADIIDDPLQSRDAFERSRADAFSGERALVGFFEAAHDVLDEVAGDELTNRYFNLLGAFVDRFSLRYDLRRPCVLCPSLPGLFASLVHDLHVTAGANPYLNALMKDFDSAVRDIRHDPSDGRIRTCIQKQMNLLEAIGRTHPGVKGTTLGKICGEVRTWPHAKVQESMANLYHFSCDYPGIRHGGTPNSALRVVDMRELVAMTIILTGFTPYLDHQLSADAIYGGGPVSLAPVMPPSASAASAGKAKSTVPPKSNGFVQKVLSILGLSG